MVDMATAQTDQPTSPKPLRLWPGVTLAILQLALRFGVPAVAPDAAAAGGIAGALCALLILIWWMFFSRVPRLERWGAILLMIAALAAAPLILHESIVNGMMGLMFYVYAIPIVSLGLVAWAVAARRLGVGLRRPTLAAAVVLACAVFALLRTDGILGGGGSQFAWRWTPTAEERLLARAGGEPLAPVPAAQASEPEPTAEPASSGAPSGGDSASTSQPAPAPGAPDAAAPFPGAAVAGTPDSPPAHSGGQASAGKLARGSETGGGAPHGQLPGETEADASAAEQGRMTAWPGFRGTNRDGQAPGIRIETDWSEFPPVELWRRAVGPGWSSFAAQGNLIYTQEQRGDDEVVSCYNLTTGEPVWMHRDATRFWESNAGAGPRGTPTLSEGRLYSFGGTGILNALDARSGAAVWARNVAAETGVEVPYWGFASSPLVAGELVIVAAAGQLAAYDRATGEPRWTGPAHGESYASPQSLTLGGVPQVVLLSHAGATSLAPADGAVLWEHPWEGFSSLQPAMTVGGDLLVTTSAATGGMGIRRLAVARQPGGWNVQERWTSTGLKPYFNDFVVHKGHAYGFDGRILSCINLENGEQQWKGGRYGNGQLILLSDQDVLLVLSDTGELALVSAAPAGFQELARFPAIEGKTWNHPAMAGDVLLVRNDREMAAFRLKRAGGH